MAHDIHDLIPGICECYFCDKSDFIGVIKLRILRWDGQSGWTLNVIMCPSMREVEGGLTTVENAV